MRTMNKVLILMFMPCLLLAGAKAAACDCVGPRGKAAVAQANLAFAGKVIEILKSVNELTAAPAPPQELVTKLEADLALAMQTRTGK